MPASSTHPGTPTIGLSHFAGRAGDHNDLAMIGSVQLASALSTMLDVETAVIGAPEPALSAGWQEELEAARPGLVKMAERLDEVFSGGQLPVTASSRCAVALATLPVVARHRPDAVVVWFDAHADLNTPQNTSTGYLGGLAYSGPLGMWDSGLGSGLQTSKAVLVGARDLDGPEQRLVDEGTVALVPVGPDMAAQLRKLIGGRPVYKHIDCDVLDAGIVPTDYLVPDGMSLEDLRATAEALAESEVVGIEIGELESRQDASNPPAYVTGLLDAVKPVLEAISHSG